MDAKKFDECTKALATGASRRQVIKGLAGGMLGALAGMFGGARGAVEAAGGGCGGTRHPCGDSQ